MKQSITIALLCCLAHCAPTYSADKAAVQAAKKSFLQIQQEQEAQQPQKVVLQKNKKRVNFRNLAVAEAYVLTKPYAYAKSETLTYRIVSQGLK